MEPPLSEKWEGGWPGTITLQPWLLPQTAAILFPFDPLLSAAVPLRGL